MLYVLTRTLVSKAAHDSEAISPSSCTLRWSNCSPERGALRVGLEEVTCLNLTDTSVEVSHMELGLC